MSSKFCTMYISGIPEIAFLVDLTFFFKENIKKKFLLRSYFYFRSSQIIRPTSVSEIYFFKCKQTSILQEILHSLELLKLSIFPYICSLSFAQMGFATSIFLSCLLSRFTRCVLHIFYSLCSCSGVWQVDCHALLPLYITLVTHYCRTKTLLGSNHLALVIPGIQQNKKK